jgi:hypothetical protein
MLPRAPVVDRYLAISPKITVRTVRHVVLCRSTELDVARKETHKL